MELSQLKNAVAEHFFNMDKVVEIIYTAVKLKKNLVLWGPGGYGKSEVVAKVLELMGKTQQTVVGYEDMDVDALIGIPNIKKLTEESKYEVAFENSVFSKHGVLVLEEFLDVRPATAAALKDILTAKGLRVGDEIKPMTIDSVIICTNKSPESLAINDSLAALYEERFPLSYEVNWDSHTRNDYLSLFQCKVKDVSSDELYVIAELIARSGLNGKRVSPRVALEIVDVFKESGVDSLWMFSSIDYTIIAEIKATREFMREQYKLTQLHEKIKKKISNLMNGDLLAAMPSLKFLLENASKTAVIDTKNVHILNSIIRDCENAIEQCVSRIQHSQEPCEELKDIFK